MSLELPQKPGWYFWFDVDLHSMAVGSVHVVADGDQHLAWLLERMTSTPLTDLDFYLYKNNDGVWLTMYHQDLGHKPPTNPDGRPAVEGYREFDFWWLVGRGNPYKPAIA